MLWNQTHRDVHPDPTRYDEVRDRTYAYATAIKSVDPSALTAGSTVWGWTAYDNITCRAFWLRLLLDHNQTWQIAPRTTWANPSHVQTGLACCNLYT